MWPKIDLGRLMVKENYKTMLGASLDEPALSRFRGHISNGPSGRQRLRNPSEVQRARLAARRRLPKALACHHSR